MPKTISSTELQKQTRDTIDYVRVEHDAVIVETYGRPMAIILPFDEYEEYLSYKQSQAVRAVKFRLLRETADANAAYSGLSEEEALQLIEDERKGIEQSQ